MMHLQHRFIISCNLMIFFSNKIFQSAASPMTLHTCKFIAGYSMTGFVLFSGSFPRCLLKPLTLGFWRLTLFLVIVGLTFCALHGKEHDTYSLKSNKFVFYK